jgi:SOS response regulatory protein OraA/RecX
MIGAALAELGDIEEVHAASRLLRRRGAAEAPEKTLARLARRGFSREVIAKAWRMG